MLPEEQRLTTDKEFGRVFQYGKGYGDNYLFIKVLSTGNPQTRLGISLSRKLGKATLRNRIKRRLRALLRELFPYLAKGYDIVIVAKSSAVDASFEELRCSLRLLLERAHLLPKEHLLANRS